jgi:uncharacterized protein YjbI with pentapeptide repeats
MPVQILRGNHFIDEIAGFYGSFGFEVNRRLSLEGVTVDLFIRKRSGGSTTHAAIDCMDHQPGPEERSQIIARHRAIADSMPNILHRVVSACSITDETRREFEASGLDLIAYADLIYEEIPLKIYANGLIADYEEWRNVNWRGEDWFVIPDVIVEREMDRSPAIEKIDQWLGDPGSNLLMILGDMGTGKSTLMSFQAYRMARDFLADCVTNPAPVFIPLAEVRQAVSWESVLTDHFRKRGHHNLGIAQFDYLARRGRIVLLFDAFDEMADQVRTDVMKSNFYELVRPLKAGAKVLFSCRTQYFDAGAGRWLSFRGESSPAEQSAAINNESGTVAGIQALYLQNFTSQQAKSYLARVYPQMVEEDWPKVEAVCKLSELSRRPLLLEMIVNMLPELEPIESINKARLFSFFTNLLAEREDRIFNIMDRQTRIDLMVELAWWLWSDDKDSASFNEIVSFFESLKNDKSIPFGGQDVFDAVRDLAAASFLKRNVDGSLSFTHESFREFFISQKLFKVLKNARTDGLVNVRKLLKTRLIDRRVIQLLTMLDGIAETYLPLQVILMERYSPQASENALHILYWSVRIRCGMEEQISDLKHLRSKMEAAIPVRPQLASANLRGAMLEAVDLREANLQGADLREANLNNAQLPDADFRASDLLDTTFFSADLARCDFHLAKRYKESNFMNANLTGAKGLSFT